MREYKRRWDHKCGVHEIKTEREIKVNMSPSLCHSEGGEIFM
jgi:hypothetical protein